MAEPMLKRIEAKNAGRTHRAAVDHDALAAAREIVAQVQADGAGAVRRMAERFGERNTGEPLVFDRDAIRAGALRAPDETIALLRTAATRIEAFARAQRKAIASVDVAHAWGRAGHTIEPVVSAGCYAPGGRYPLVSSALMTAIPARVAGVKRVVLASPDPAPAMLAAAMIADVDEVLAVGGAHAVASLAHGIDGLAPCDVVVGPGNRFVTAAKLLVSAQVGIDMLAGPSELLILADESADAAAIAADLLAQAEHDDDALPMLMTTSESLADVVDAALVKQLATLPTRKTAAAALRNGFCAMARCVDEASAAADRIAAEHVQVMTRDAAAVAARLRHAGAVFIGSSSAEVFGDYAAGPNHTLPTGGAARFGAGLSVMTYLRLRTWLRVDDPAGDGLAASAAALARLEGLEAHARAAERRIRAEP